MKVQRVYVDTSVLGGCFDHEFAVWSNTLMIDFRLGRRRAVLSEMLEAELLDAPTYVQDLYSELLGLGSEIALITDETIELANLYQQRRILTPKYYDDGVHIAVATVADVDVLVSWNFKHIVHFDKIRLFNAVNIEQGYKPLAIYSPREVASYDNEEH